LKNHSPPQAIKLLVERNLSHAWLNNDGPNLAIVSRDAVHRREIDHPRSAFAGPSRTEAPVFAAGKCMEFHAMTGSRLNQANDIEALARLEYARRQTRVAGELCLRERGLVDQVGNLRCKAGRSDHKAELSVIISSGTRCLTFTSGNCSIKWLPSTIARLGSFLFVDFAHISSRLAQLCLSSAD
jgi:hypothetical protein